MSHFVGLCFGEDFEYNLERYYEGNDVEEYVDYTKEEAIAEIKKDRPDISDEEAWEYVKESWGYTINEKDELVNTYNPESKWDWYCVGGRWSNYLPMAEFDENDNVYYQDIATVGEVDWEQYKKEHNAPFCFVDLDGEWHECAHMGWWGMTSDDNENWENEFWEYVNSLPEDTVITTVDFHI